MINGVVWKSAVFVGAAATLAGGCSSSGKSSSQAAADCSTPVQGPKTSQTLPHLFPTPRGISYGSITTINSTTFVRAFSSSSRQITFDLYKRDLASNPYQVSRSQFNDRDAEIYFQGNGMTGHLAVLAACPHVVPVNITLQQAAATGQ